MTQDREAFLDRWSRRKLDQAEEPPAAPAPALERAQNDEHEPVVALQPIEELNPESDFVPFMKPNVDGETRRAALKKLFADAHFNVPDPFEAYSEDYTVSESIPLEMLKTLNHAQKLLFDDPEKKVEAAAAAVAPSEAPQGETPQAETPQADTPQKDAKDAVGKQDA